MNKRLGILALLLLSGPLAAAIQMQEVDYKDGDTALKGFLYWDDSITGKRPGVMVVHEWWGLNDYARQRAQMLADRSSRSRLQGFFQEIVE